MGYIDNWPLMEETILYIDTHPEEHDQTDWVRVVDIDENHCRTTRCLAGWAAHLAGWRPRDGHDESRAVNHPAQVLSGDYTPRSAALESLGMVRTRDYLEEEPYGLVSRLIPWNILYPGSPSEKPVWIEDALFDGDISWVTILERIARLAAADEYALSEAVRAVLVKHGVTP